MTSASRTVARTASSILLESEAMLDARSRRSVVPAGSVTSRYTGTALPGALASSPAAAADSSASADEASPVPPPQAAHAAVKTITASHLCRSFTRPPCVQVRLKADTTPPETEPSDRARIRCAKACARLIGQRYCQIAAVRGCLGSLGCRGCWGAFRVPTAENSPAGCPDSPRPRAPARSEEHTSELQSQSNLVCRLLLEKKNPPSRTSTTRC